MPLPPSAPRRSLLQLPNSSARLPSPLTSCLLVNDPSSLPPNSRPVWVLPGGLRGKRSVVQPTGLTAFSTFTCQTGPGNGTHFPTGTWRVHLWRRRSGRGPGPPLPHLPSRWTGPVPRQRPLPPTPWPSRVCPRWEPESSGAGATGASAGWRTSGNPLRGCTGHPGSPPDWATA